MVSRLEADIGVILNEEGEAGLVRLPAIDKGIAASIRELLTTGRWAQLEGLRGTLDSVDLFCTVPGIEPKMAEEIHETLHIDTLEAAAWDGRLETVPGIGSRRVSGIRSALGALLGSARRRPEPSPGNAPDIGLLQEVDGRYREQAVAGRLPMIVPRRSTRRAGPGSRCYTW